MRRLDQALLGSWTFFASPHSVDICGINGLPLTPNSIRILGRFQHLKMLDHDRLCKYLDIIRGKHERLMIVCEQYLSNIQQEEYRKKLESNISNLAQLAFEVLDGLDCLHNNQIVHHNLSPNCILLDSKNHVKLTNYGLYYMTECGACVSFPIGVPKYLAPEVIVGDIPGKSDYVYPSPLPSGPKSDIWSLGVIILELVLGKDLWSHCSVDEIFQEMMLLIKLNSGHSVLYTVAKEHDVIQKLETIPSTLKSFLETCLTVEPTKRPNASQLLKHEFFKEFGLEDSYRIKTIKETFPSTDLRCRNLILPKSVPIINDHLSFRPLEEVYYLWQLAGGDVEAELRKQGLIKAKPPICSLPKIILEEGEEFGQKKDRAMLLNDTVIILPLDQLRQRLKDMDPSIYYPLIMENGPNTLTSASSSSEFKDTVSLPLVIREKDIEYQLHRIILYSRLLEAYPYKRSQIVREARVDIPPLYRSYIWASLLEVEGDVQGDYDAIDKETPTATDRQIEVDIPRCHQYNELLSSPTGHAKFKRILKAWVVSHPEYVYWQGLDSLCAPFLYLNFNNEALAYVCLSAFIPKYLNNFFLKDNSPVIQGKY